ncbi:hypothetical protein CesoFtcFv8_021500 [Champsocephalus esox]|uniref:U1-type domain-containing protein n=1 Tax=Champsocephalus esox TaxID=159716 RepID=A0AAN8GN04_9TELE|nr:hypothetical protein CesoFtcFv8_021500 [Champsocephalus esox]
MPEHRDGKRRFLPAEFQVFYRAPPPPSHRPPSLFPSSPRPPPRPATPPEPFEYYDAGNHWCKNCNVTSGSMFDFYTHLHSKTHRKTLDPYDRPWSCTGTTGTSKSLLTEEKLTKPAKGSEFLLPVRGFFCLLCKAFYGDSICAEEHVTKHAHNEKYKKQMYENPLYEQRRNLDRQAGLTSDAGGKKRKHEDEACKDKEEKSKHKKDKKKKEEVPTEEKVEEKPGQKEEDLKTPKGLEEERPSFSKKEEEEEQVKGSKKEDKYRHRREEDRYKYSREEEHRHRNDNRPKYGPRDEDSKQGKYPESRIRSDREEGKPKEPFKKPQPEKPAAKPEPIQEPPPKPYDPPKILCGPSPAMRAKLRKQSLEVGKPAAGPASLTSPTFGKFTWKKRENFLAKEAEKVAAEFIKEDEAAANLDPAPAPAQDSFSKSVAVAKEIAQKLGGHQTPPWFSNGANRGRIRPNLPAPAAVLRKTALMGKPAPLNTFLSMRPQGGGLPVQQEVPTISDGLLKIPNARKKPQESKPLPPSPAPGTAMPPPLVTRPFEAKPPPAVYGPALPPPVLKSAPFEAKPPPAVYGPALPPPVLKSAPFEAKPPPAVFGPMLPPAVLKPALFEAKPPPSVFGPLPPPAVLKPAPFETKPPPSVFGPAPFEAKPPPPVFKPAPPVCNPPPSVSRPPPSETAPFPKPVPPPMIRVVSDVAAPGVPEGEQTRTVFVKPPPFMNLGDGAQKSEKLKTHLAAAKAQDLFHLLYSKGDQTGAANITKPPADPRGGDGTSSNKTHLAPIQAAKPPPESLTKTTLPSEPLSKTTPPPESLPIQTPDEPPPNLSPLPKAQDQTPAPTSEPNISPQSNPAKVEPAPQTRSPPKLAPEIQKEPQPTQDLHLNLEPQLDHHTQLHPNPQPDSTPEPAPKPGPKTRGKKTPAAPRPVRQTRSQTRYQTRQQKSDPEPASGDSDSAASDSKGLDTSDPGLDPSPGLEGEKGPSEGEDLPTMEITPETLGLPSDLTSLDFDYDFNFE